MDELMVIRRIRKLVYHLLRDFPPFGATNFRAYRFAQLVKRDRVFHSLPFPADIISSSV
ncbi:hypothetical protein [Brucella sp. 09RB8910]|uniref:hypothetical protein n=1 Tax=Brucella sp. 09RB8910 TaxID=1844051 RepID=UPI001FFD5F69|nr:hypothetical protein [Brucella sp. 09RB8910]